MRRAFLITLNFLSVRVSAHVELITSKTRAIVTLLLCTVKGKFEFAYHADMTLLVRPRLLRRLTHTLKRGMGA